MTWPEYGIGDAGPGEVAFPAWTCPRCEKRNDMLNGRCKCGWHRLCEVCGSDDDVHLYPKGVRCGSHR